MRQNCVDSMVPCPLVGDHMADSFFRAEISCLLRLARINVQYKRLNRAIDPKDLGQTGSYIVGLPLSVHHGPRAYPRPRGRLVQLGGPEVHLRVPQSSLQHPAQRYLVRI